jgi:MFS family permease
MSACLTGVSISGISAVLPQIQESLNTNIVVVGWIMSIYSLIAIPSMVTIGKISDMFGRKPTFIACCFFFLAGSLGVALSSSPIAVILFRCVTAIGGGGMPPAAISIVADAFPDNRQRMLALVMGVFPLAQVLGPNIGVLVVTAFGSWRALFWMCVIIMVLALLVAVTCMEKSKRKEGVTIKHIDFLGAIYLVVTVLALMLAITFLKSFKGSLPASDWARIIICFVLCIVFALIFVRHVRKVENPIIDKNVLFAKEFASTNAFFFIFGFIALGMALMIPTYASKVYGFPPVLAASVVGMKGIGWFLTGLVVVALIKKWGYRKPLLVAIALIAVSYVIFAISPNEPFGLSNYTWIYVIAAILGVGTGLVIPVITNAAVDLMPHSVGTIYGVTAMFQQMGSSLCVQVVTVILTLAGNFVIGFRITYLLMAVLILCTIKFVFNMRAGVPEEGQKIRTSLH